MVILDLFDNWNRSYHFRVMMASTSSCSAGFSEQTWRVRLQKAIKSHHVAGRNSKLIDDQKPRNAWRLWFSVRRFGRFNLGSDLQGSTASKGHRQLGWFGMCQWGEHRPLKAMLCTCCWQINGTWAAWYFPGSTQGKKGSPQADCSLEIFDQGFLCRKTKVYRSDHHLTKNWVQIPDLYQKGKATKGTSPWSVGYVCSGSHGSSTENWRELTLKIGDGSCCWSCSFSLKKLFWWSTLIITFEHIYVNWRILHLIILLLCITLHYIPLHYVALHSIASHCITLHYIALHSIALHCVSSLECIALYHAALLNITWLCCLALPCTLRTIHDTRHTAHHTPRTTHQTLHTTHIYIFWSEHHAFTFDVCARLSSEGQPDPLKQKLSLPQVMVICCNSHHTLDEHLPYPVRQMSSAKLRKRISRVTGKALDFIWTHFLLGGLEGVGSDIVWTCWNLTCLCPKGFRILIYLSDRFRIPRFSPALGCPFDLGLLSSLNRFTCISEQSQDPGKIRKWDRVGPSECTFVCAVLHSQVWYSDTHKVSSNPHSLVSNFPADFPETLCVWSILYHLVASQGMRWKPENAREMVARHESQVFQFHDIWQEGSHHWKKKSRHSQRLLRASHGRWLVASWARSPWQSSWDNDGWLFRDRFGFVNSSCFFSGLSEHDFERFRPPSGWLTYL